MRFPIALALIAAPLVPSLAAQDRPDADSLVEDAWRFLPAYDGEHRASLTDDVRRETLAGAHLLEAALALEPEHLRGLWSAGHAWILLAEDRRTHGDDAESERCFARADAALSRAIELNADDPWTLYARGAARTSFGRAEAAVPDLERAVRLAGEATAAGEGGNWMATLRYKALEWLPEAWMRQGEHERAREALRAFHDEFSTNEWPLAIALAESRLRERDLEGARAAYETVLGTFGSDHQAYALLGYVAGLRGDRELATARLRESLERELQPGLYGRMWLWILATDDARGAAEEDLRGFLEYPPPSVSEWDATLGRFVVGDGPAEEFLEAARAERARRLAAAEPVDDLMCEALYYVGLRAELDAAREETARTSHLQRALRAYRAATEFRPAAWKWEWAFARAGLARTAAALGHGEATKPGAGTALRRTWHVPGAPRAVEDLGRKPRTGDLLISVTRDDERGVHVELGVAMAR